MSKKRIVEHVNDAGVYFKEKVVNVAADNILTHVDKKQA